jgi:phosphomannomutase
LKFEGAARSWLEIDPDAKNRKELEQLLASGDEAGLTDRFGSRLQFGTAGLRAQLGAGPNRMNRIVVAQTALGLARFLNENRSNFADKAGELSVVIGHDARNKSDEFALESAEILAAAGIRVKKFAQLVATPILAFTAKHLGASAAIMVTASHNPREDNGYKVYLGGVGGGSQLTSPADADISAAIDQVVADEALSYPTLSRSGEFELLGQQAVEAYLERALQLEPKADSDLRICHTAMHGVGWLFIEPLLERAGFCNVVPVAEQQQPDGKFPTLPFPNPEEPGALDYALETANRTGCELILATDPDADRLAAVALHRGSWRTLSGDELGLLLGERIAGRNTEGALATSIVSAQHLELVAKQHGLSFTTTLTGFKWISKVPNLVFGYEEALGYCVDPRYTPDKDGLTAALAVASLAAELKSNGKTLIDALEQLAEKYGHFATRQISIRLNSQREVAHLMNRLRSDLAKHNFDATTDVTDWLKNPDAKRRTDALEISGSGYRLLVRPSGTESKLKCYLQAKAASAEQAATGLDAATELANRLLRD